MIKNVILDIGNVLIDFHWDKTMRKYGISEQAIQTLGEQMIHNKLWAELDLCLRPEEEIIAEFKKHVFGYRAEIDTFFAHIDEAVTSFPGSRSWIEDLKERGYRVYLLSNYPGRTFEIHAREQFDFMDLIDGSLISYEIHAVKPDPRIYEELLSRYSLLPEECVFLDDRQDNVDAAVRLGMQGILVKNQEQAIKDLDDLLKLCFVKLGQELLYESNVMKLCQETLRLPDGREVVWDIVKQKGGAAVLPIDADENVYLVKQYRNTLNRLNLELPAGCYDSQDELPNVCAMRELKEELGIEAKKLTYFTEIITDIGISTEKVTIFFAEGLSFGEIMPDDSEFIRLCVLPYTEALKMVRRGEIVDAKTVVAILGYAHWKSSPGV